MCSKCRWYDKATERDFHQKKLVGGMIVGKEENKEYALTTIGEVLLDYFSEFIPETQEIHKRLDK